MRTREEKEMAAKELEPLRKRLDGWRAGHKGRRLGIPEEFWGEAVKAARRYGVWRVAKVLRLEYPGLKRRLNANSGQAVVEKQATPAFIELRTHDGNGSNVIELQKPGGSKLRIEFRDKPSRELARLSERLWRSSR